MTVEEKRELLVKNLLDLWKDSDAPWGKKLWTAVTKIMVFVGGYKDFAGADKKKEALAALHLLLDKTDAPGPDFIVDPFIEWCVESGMDALYEAAQGAIDFDGGE